MYRTPTTEQEHFESLKRYLALAHGLTLEDLNRKDHTRHITDLRSMSVAYLRQHYRISVLSVLFKRNRSTIHQLLRRHRELLQVDNDYKALFRTLEEFCTI